MQKIHSYEVKLDLNVIVKLRKNFFYKKKENYKVKVAGLVNEIQLAFYFSRRHKIKKFKMKMSQKRVRFL